MIREIPKRFWAKVDIGEPDECWNWTAKVNTHGYGFMRVNYRWVVATHISLELDGRPRSAECALHSCDNPLCVNPKHLRWGSRKENTQDMDRRGRRGFGWRKPAFLSAEQQDAIRADPRSCRELSKAMGIGTTTISKVRRFLSPHGEREGGNI